jgi:type II secretion system protein D
MRRFAAPLPRSHKSRLSIGLSGSALCLILAALFCGEVAGQAPPLVQSEARPAEVPTLLPYPFLPAHEPQIIALEQQYASRGDVRIARDARTSQLLVLAPPDVHAHIAQVLSTAPNELRDGPRLQAQPLVDPAASGRASEAEGQRQFAPGLVRHADGSEVQEGGIARRSVQLANLTVDEVHDRLQRLMGRPLPLQEGASQANVQFGIEAAPGVRVSVAADRSTGRMIVIGRPDLAESWARVISAMDSANQPGGTVTRLVATRHAQKDHLRLVAQTLSAQPGRGAYDGGYAGPVTAEGQLVARLFQPGGDQGDQLQPPANGQPPAVQPDGQEPQEQIDPAQAIAGLIGQVQIEYIEGLDIIVVRGNPQDVQQVMDLIEQIERLTQEEPLRVEVHPLQHVQSEAMQALVQPVYDAAFGPRQGTISITPLVTPNALLLIGRDENVESVIQLIRQLDVPADPTKEFKVFFLQHAGALEVQSRILETFGGVPAGAQQQQQGLVGLAPRVIVTADFRTNSLIVRAAPRDMVEVTALVEQLDTDQIVARMGVREFKLKNALASDLANVLLGALSTQAARTQGQGGQQQGFGGQQQGFGGQQQGFGGQQQGFGGQQQLNQPRSTMVELLTIDAQGNRVITETSGVLTDIRVVPDDRSNTLVVTAPLESMDLIAALIDRLDQASELIAQVKVFTIQRGDALSMADMLRELFGQATTGGGGAGGFGGGGGGGQFGQGLGAITTGGETTLIPLRISVDERTNSIVASGTSEALNVVQAILLTLDGYDVRNRQTRVFKLKNLYSVDVATALTNWITAEQEVAQIIPGVVSAVEQIEREAIIVPEEASNSLIVSATPTLFEEIRRIVEEIDARPPMIMVQVLIAEVTLNDTDEFGVEMAVQDSILFDRGILSNIVTTARTTTTTTPGGAVTTVQEDIIQSANRDPGFEFLNPLASLGNSAGAGSHPESLGTQGIANFGVGRINSELGFGGFVFSAGNENLNILLRALQESRRLEILSRPQVMALDNQPAVVQVGQQVPFLLGSTIAAGVVQNQIDFRDVGLILQVQPRVSPDGMVVMAIQAEKSEVGPESEGIPVTTSETGEVVRVPRINRTFAGTIVQALSGQTIVLGGLITRSTTDVHRRVPLIAEIPIVGDLFRYDFTRETRSELLIIMTPRVVRNYLDAEMVKQVEASRMNWVLGDVVGLHGPSGLKGRTDLWSDEETHAIYPTHVPAEGETVLPPAGTEPQAIPQQAPLPTVPMTDAADAGRIEQVYYDAAPADFQREAGQVPPPARQAAYDQLTPLPPTKP